MIFPYSPKKPASRDHSDEEDSENGRKSAELKVPPLKIVLSGSGQSANGGSDDKKSPIGKFLVQGVPTSFRPELSKKWQNVTKSEKTRESLFTV